MDVFIDVFCLVNFICFLALFNFVQF